MLLFPLIFHGFLPCLANRVSRLAKFCSRFKLSGSGVGEAFTVRRPGIALYLRQADPAAPCHNLVVGAAMFGEACCTGLAQAMCAPRYAGEVALLAEPVPEPGSRERLALLGREESQVVVGHGIHGRLQLGQDWNIDRRPGLILSKRNDAILDVLPAKSHNVAPVLHGAVEQFQREAWPGAERMLGAILFDVLVSPGLESASVLDLRQLDAGPSFRIVARRINGRSAPAVHKPSSPPENNHGLD